MLGRLLLLGITGLAAWKYRDSLREYVKGNAGPAREKAAEGANLLAARERSGEVERGSVGGRSRKTYRVVSYSARGLASRKPKSEWALAPSRQPIPNPP
jgi:hypothetical protein